MSQGYICQCCGLYENSVPMSYATDEPIYVHSMSKEERDSSVHMDDNLCVINDEHYFIRGRIEIPVIDAEENFSWGVWTTTSYDNFRKMVTHWEAPGRECIVEPAFGYLSTPIPIYDDTLNLHVLTHTMPIGQIPSLELEPTNHPLALDQRNGITMARVHEIAKLLMPS